MERFRYQARRIDGFETAGFIHANSSEEAAGMLQQAGVYVISITPTGQAVRLAKPGRVVIPDQERTFLLECWAMFLEAGLSMQTALLRLRMRTRLPKLAAALDYIQQCIDEGATLAEALKQADLFPPSWIAVISMGEDRGDYVQPLRTLQKEAEDYQKLKQEMISLLIIPCILLVMVGIWLWLIVVKVIPSMMMLLGQFGWRLPFRLPSGADWDVHLVGLRWFFAIGGGLFTIYLLTRRSNQEMSFIQSWLPTWTPFFGKLISSMQLIVVSNSLRLQMEAGVPLVRALEILSLGISHRRVKRDLTVAYRKLMEGLPVPQAMASVEIIPWGYQALIAAGEVSGKLPDMFAIMARETQSVLIEDCRRLTTIIRSFVVLIVGLLVGVVMITFFTIFFSALANLTSGNLSQQHRGDVSILEKR